MTKTLVIDTETTGLPPLYYGKFLDPITHCEKWGNKCRTVQIAWILYDDDDNIVKRESHIIKPNGYHIPEESTRIHGISQEKAEKEGIDIGFVLSMLKSDIIIADTIVAHNMEFDYKVILYEWLLEDKETIDIWKNTHRVCTMKDFLKDKNMKWPKLSDLYSSLFNKDLDKAHNALYDASACADIYFKLSRGGYKITN
jgi:DNA polymerase-3 subunit alpha